MKQQEIQKTKEALMLEATGIKCDGTCGITWFVGTNDFGDCLYGFTPFGAYTIYERYSEMWIVTSICNKEVTFKTEEEAIEAIEKDFKSRIYELLGKPYLPSERLVDSYGWREAEEFEISNEEVEQ